MSDLGWSWASAAWRWRRRPRPYRPSAAPQDGQPAGRPSCPFGRRCDGHQSATVGRMSRPRPAGCPGRDHHSGDVRPVDRTDGRADRLGRALRPHARPTIIMGCWAAGIASSASAPAPRRPTAWTSRPRRVIRGCVTVMAPGETIVSGPVVVSERSYRPTIPTRRATRSSAARRRRRRAMPWSTARGRTADADPDRPGPGRARRCRRDPRMAGAMPRPGGRACTIPAVMQSSIPPAPTAMSGPVTTARTSSAISSGCPSWAGSTRSVSRQAWGSTRRSPMAIPVRRSPSCRPRWSTARSDPADLRDAAAATA